MVCKRCLKWILIGAAIGVSYFQNDAANNDTEHMITMQINSTHSPNTTQVTTPLPPLVIKNISCESDMMQDKIYFTVAFLTRRHLETSKVRMIYAKIPFDGPAGDPKLFKDCVYKIENVTTLITCKTVAVLDYNFYDFNLTYDGIYSVPLIKNLRPVTYFDNCGAVADFGLKVNETTETSITLLGHMTFTLAVLMYGTEMDVYDKVSKLSRNYCGFYTMRNFSCVAQKLEKCHKYKLYVFVRLSYNVKPGTYITVATKGCSNETKLFANGFTESKHRIVVTLVMTCVCLAVVAGLVTWWRKPLRSLFLRRKQRVVTKYSRFDEAVFMIGKFRKISADSSPDG